MSPVMLLRLGTVVAAVALAATVYWWIYSSGADAVKLAIERQNNGAGKVANEAELDHDLCMSKPGGLYDFGTGKCRWFETGDGQ